MSLPVCKFYISNKSCKFGNNCRYLHPSGQRPPPSSVHRSHNDSVNRNHSSDSAPATSTSIPDSQNQDESVDPKPVSQTPASSVNEKDATGSQSQVDPGKRQQDKLKVKQKVCVHFARGGYCYYGKSCRFSHDLPTNFSRRQSERRPQTSANSNLPPRLKSKQPEKKDEGDNQNEPKHVNASSIDVEVKSDDLEHPSLSLVESKQKSKVNKQLSARPRICQFFKSSRCNRGERCRFVHPPDLLENVDWDESEKRDTPRPSESVPKERNPRGTASNKPGYKVSSGRSQARPIGPSGVKSILTYIELEEVGITKVRESEINVIQKRFSKDKITTVANDENGFSARIKFTPSDPDWPFDVEVFEILVAVPGNYPKQTLKISLPKDQDIPETVRRYVEISIGEWLEEKQKRLASEEKVELLFRPFLKWLDRAIEDLTTEALKQLKRELVAKAAGMEFISPKQLQERFKANSESSTGDQSNSGGEHDDDDDGSSEDSEEESDDDDDDSSGNEGGTTQSLDLDPEKKGTEIELRHLQLREKVSALLFDKLKLVIQCGRCKNHSDLEVHQGKVTAVRCHKCSQNQFVNYRAALLHQFSSTLGYLDTDGCQAFDLILQDCRVLVSCLWCNKQTRLEGMISGQMTDAWCKACNAKLKLATEAVKFTQLAPSGVDTSVNKVVEVTPAKSRKPPKDPAIREGYPLPGFGTCKHYKHSYRWLRFPCCGKVYPCDVCHDRKEDHEMTFATRMICGHCCKEQNYAGDRPCRGCGQHMTKVRSSHWEGGAGCRDKIAMNRGDSAKYRNLNKTISNHKKSLKHGGSTKKNTKLRHC